MTAKRICLQVLTMIAVGFTLAITIASLARPSDAAAPPEEVGASLPLGSTPTPVCGVAWRGVPAPNPGSNVFLRGVTAINANVVWAVGDYSNGQQLLTMRWNGFVWEVVPNPNPGGNYANYLYAVSGVATDDVWAVGFYRRFSPNSLIMHWDGNTWTYESGPFPGTIPWLYGVHAIAPNDVWAVGYTGNQESLIYHWDGSNWSIVPSPNILTLYGVGGTASNDAWAVGINGILHWDGTQWSTSPAVDLGAVRDVDALTANDAWAVSDSGIQHWNGSVWSVSHVGGGTSVKAIAADDVWVTGTSGMLHWNGTQWSPAPSPYGGMAAIAGVAANDLWAVGSSSGSALTEHYSYECAVGTSTPTSTPTATITPTATATCGPPAWNITTSPNEGMYDNFLYGITTVSATDIWAVGYYCTGDCTAGPSQTLVMHWDGADWSIVPSQNVGQGSNALFSVSALSANDIWAVGNYVSGAVARTLVLHWDGAAWAVVSSPNTGTGDNVLNSVSAQATNDVWAAGYHIGTGGALQTLVMRWNGTAWGLVTSPNPGTVQNLLANVEARTSNDAWAVGSQSSGSGGRTLVIRWNGTAWNVVPSQNVGTLPNILYAATALSASDVWAVGHYFINGAVTQTLIEHWDGASWSVVPSPNVGTGLNTLRAVRAYSANDIWAVGHYCNGSCGTNPYQTLILHWNGSAWSTVSSPNIASVYNYLVGVAPVSANEAWAIGHYRTSGAVYKTLILRRYGVSCDTITPTPTQTRTSTPASTLTFTRTPTPTFTDTPIPPTDTRTSTWTRTPTHTRTATDTPLPTQTPGGPTATPTETPTETATSTPTYTDTPTFTLTPLPPTSTRTRTFTPIPTNTPIPTGTPLPTQTPGEPTVTPTTCPMDFSDVQESDYFYVPVRYLYCAGVISGYTDGTFRPYNNTTRGQLSKIVVLAEGWKVICPTQPQFTDVPTDHPFYCFIETAFDRGIIAGYADGTFRPGNDVTRGQLCKIIVLAEAWQNVCPPNPTFTDVPTDHTFYCYVETAYARGIVSGYEDGTFRPGNNATRGQICKIVYQAVTQP